MRGEIARFYRPELDVLRFIAFLMVFTFHVHGVFPDRFAFIPEAGDAGVSVFFVLSSYLIGELLLREREAKGRLDLRRFYLRRMLRIWPLYFFLVLNAFSLAHFAGWGEFPVPALVAFCLLVGNLYIASAGWTVSAGVALLWTISIEEQFYLLAPVLWSRAKRGAILAFALGCILLAYVTLGVLYWRGGDDQHVWCSSLVQFQYFGLGTLLALGLHGRTLRLTSTQRVLLLLFSAACFLSTEGLFRFRDYPVGWHTCAGYLVLVAGSASLLVAFLGWQFASKFPKLIYLGRISYGLYAYHLIMAGLVIRLLAPHNGWIIALPHGFLLFGCCFFAVTLASTVAVASLSYRYLESPFLRLKRRFEVVKSQPQDNPPGRNVESDAGTGSDGGGLMTSS